MSDTASLSQLRAALSTYQKEIALLSGELDAVLLQQQNSVNEKTEVEEVRSRLAKHHA